MTTAQTAHLCTICRGLNLKPDTFVQTGLRYPTTLVYETLSDIFDDTAEDNSGGQERADTGHAYYVEGERLTHIDVAIKSKQGKDSTSISEDLDDLLDTGITAAPQRHVFDETGELVRSVPPKWCDLGSLLDVRNRALTGCGMCQLVVVAAKSADDTLSTQQFPHHSSQSSRCEIRFIFKDVEAVNEQQEKEQSPETSIAQYHIANEPYVSQASMTAQQYGYYECTISIGSDCSVLVYPILRDESEFSWFGGRAIQPEIDYVLVQQWLSACVALHPECSAEKNRIDVSLVEQLRVIDVVEGCLTGIHVPSSRFVALSYVWGDALTLKVTQLNLKEFSRPGGLETHAAEIPNTTKDAMYMVKQLGLRYLWTDSLCILQDTPSEMVPQLRRMDLVYASAYFTIVAAEGTSVAAGLPGVTPQRGRDTLKTFKYSDDLDLMLVPKDLPSLLLDCPWSTRLWTLQEAYMGQRLLILGLDGVHFSCSSLHWSENLKTVSEQRPPPWKQFQEKYFRFRSALVPDASTSTSAAKCMWDMELWLYMIMESSQRKLTFEWDIENATLGLIAQLETLYHTNSVFGMPECCLHEFLLWSSTDSGRLQRRRDESGAPFHPSWSWSGWIGEVGWHGGDASDVEEGSGSTEVLILKQRSLDTEPVPLDKQGTATRRVSLETYPYLLISSRIITLEVNRDSNAPNHIRSLHPLAWSVVLPKGAQRVGVYPASTHHATHDPVASVVFDSVDMCPNATNFECQFLQIYPKAQTLEYDPTAGDPFVNVLAIRVCRALSSGIVLAERIGHGRICCTGTYDMWVPASIVLQ